MSLLISLDCSRLFMSASVNIISPPLHIFWTYPFRNIPGSSSDSLKSLTFISISNSYGCLFQDTVLSVLSSLQGSYMAKSVHTLTVSTDGFNVQVIPMDLGFLILVSASDVSYASTSDSIAEELDISSISLSCSFGYILPVV